jgi:S1-C subfamily serine protease/mono/diheme cytochrome c family protein
VTSCVRFFALAAVVLATTARGQPATDPQEIVFLLQYVGTDYGNAVRDGAVANQAEYGEVLRFTRRAIDGYRTLHRRRASVTRALATLETRIGERAPTREVWTLANRLAAKMNRTVGGAARPEQIPNVANGRRLWMADCAGCHGLDGAGEGAAASKMEPPPTAFRGEFLERLSPAQIYNAVSLGVGGTAMPSFATAYTPHQRWDVAFYAMTLRLGFDPKRPPAGTTFTLEDVAASSNDMLLERLRRTAPDASPEQVDWFRVNLVSPQGATAPMAGPGSAATGGLALAMQMQDAFAAVAERVFPRVVGISGWVKDPTWTDQRLRAEKGDGWMVANADLFRYPGFRRIRAGSGFIVDDEGFVVSADALVRDDAGALVPLVEAEISDESRVPCAIVGNEPMLDLVVLRLASGPPTDLPPLEIGDSDRVQAGHWLIALGDPPGPDRSFVVGVAAMSPQRQCYQATMSATRLQTSLQIPPGGVGGPVVDILGNVIGVGVGQAQREGAPTGGVMPITLVMNLFEALKAAKSHQSPWLGISVLELQTLRKQMATGKHATVAMPPTGVFIDDVFEPSPASRAGVRPGDFLTALGGHPILSVGDFQTWLYAAGAGALTELMLVRHGKPFGLQVRVEVRPASATTH